MNGPRRAAMGAANGRTKRIAAGQGFWGDWLEAPVWGAELIVCR